MGHFVTALVGSKTLLEDFAQARALHSSIELTPQLSILPLRDEDIDSFLTTPIGEVAERFTFLSSGLRGHLEIASQHGSILYLETEYHGGTGGQGAALFSGGKLVFGPKWDEIGPINQGLALLGVTPLSPGGDEFDAVGLGRYRSSEDWIEPPTYARVPDEALRPAEVSKPWWRFW